MPGIEKKTYGFPVFALSIMLLIIFLFIYIAIDFVPTLPLEPIGLYVLIHILFGIIVIVLYIFYKFFISKSWRERITISENGLKIRHVDKSYGNRKLNTIELPWREISKISLEMFGDGGGWGSTLILEIAPKSGKPIKLTNLGSSRLWVNKFVKQVMQTGQFEQLGKPPGIIFSSPASASVLLRKKS